MKQKAYAKVNIFLKIVGIRGDYHEIKSRFVLVKNLFDELELVPKRTKQEFELYGDFGCELKSNTIYKAYEAFKKASFQKELVGLFEKYALHVEKNIPSFAGLGGGSSDAATFMLMVNERANLNLTDNELAKIGINVGADVPFFIFGYESANVSGIGEIVEKFDEQTLHVEIITPDIKCDTGKIYRAFREDYKIDKELALSMSNLKSEDLLENYNDMELNDLLAPALKIDKNLEKYRNKNWFLSGSGSSFFKIIDKKT